MKEYMDIAIHEAKKAFKKGDVPVGAVIVRKGIVVSKAYNKKEKKNNAIAHAEIIAINKACKKLKTWHLDDCELYVTLEPCLMCCGGIIQSRISKLFYSTESSKFGYVESIDTLFNKKNNHKLIIEKGLCKEESINLLIKFFSDKRS